MNKLSYLMHNLDKFKATDKTTIYYVKEVDEQINVTVANSLDDTKLWDPLIREIATKKITKNKHHDAIYIMFELEDALFVIKKSNYLDSTEVKKMLNVLMSKL